MTHLYIADLTYDVVHFYARIVYLQAASRSRFPSL